MATSVEAQVIDSKHLQLKRPIKIPAGSTVIITIESIEGDIDYQGWYLLSAQGLEAAYGENEPDYPAELIKIPNEEYRL